MVILDGHQSSKSAVTSGVPQGTVLGPVLFLVLIADIADGTSNQEQQVMDSQNSNHNTNVSSFADDTRASRMIKNSGDYSILQNDLNIIYQWAVRVNMQFNGDKFELLRCWPEKHQGWAKHLPFQFKNEFQYVDCKGDPILEKEDIKDLGVMLSSDLTFTCHIKKTVKKCRQQAGLIFRTFRTRSQSSMLTLWKSLIQSRLDYCSQLWSTNNASEIKLLEDVQRSFTSRINGMEELTYRERLKALRLYSQERRRERYMIIFIWKVAMKLVGGYNLEILEHGRRGRLCHVKDIPASAPASVKRAAEASLAVKGAKIFNMLPIHLRNISSDKVDTFKYELDRYLATIPDEPTSEQEGRAAETNSLLHQVPMSRQPGHY